MIIKVYYEFKKKMQEKNHFPSILFLNRKSLLKIFFGAELFNCRPIFNFVLHILGQTKHRILQGNILPTTK